MPTYCVSGIFGPDGAKDAAAMSEEQAFSEHLAQRAFRVHLAGPLFDGAGVKTGWMIVVDAASFGEAQAYLGQSPYRKMYQSTSAYEFRTEVGKVS